MKAIVGFLLSSMILANGASALADSLAQDEALAGQAITNTADGIDIYPSTATEDGENHYIHIGEVSGQDGPGIRYVFEYCRNGLPVELAKKGEFPARRDCYHAIGNASGYTKGEIRAELDLMGQQANSQRHSQLLSSIGSSVVSGVVVLVALNLVEAVTTGGAANVPTDAAVVAGDGALGALRSFLGSAALKKVALEGSKLLVSTVVGTFLGQTITNHVAQADTRHVNDYPFSSPYEIKYEVGQVRRLFSSGSVVVIKDNMEAFESDLSQILAKIQ